jgi:hypothetical protein
MGDGMEVEVDEVSVIEAKLRGMLDKGLLKAQEVDLIQGVGISRQGGTFGQRIESCKKPEPWVKGLVADMGIAFCAEEFQGQEREEITQRRYPFGSRQTGLAHDLREMELAQEGSEEEHPCSGGFPMAAIEFS